MIQTYKKSSVLQIRNKTENNEMDLDDKSTGLNLEEDLLQDQQDELRKHVDNSVNKFLN